MPLIEAVILALVQAVTEFLPVSSTAHLVLVPWLFGWRPHGLLFDIAVHLGTLVAVLIYFLRTWLRLLFLAFGRSAWRPEAGEADSDLYENPRLFWFLAAATFPAGIAGLALKDYVETVFRSPVVIGVMLIVVGLIIAWAEKVGSFKRNLDSLRFLDAMAIGCAQTVALIPGTSRSGITMSAAMLLGLTRHSAARFSFLLSTPIILGAGLKTALDAADTGVPEDMIAPLAVGFVVSAAAGYAVIAFFLRFLQRFTLRFFVYYRVIFGIIVLALAFFCRLPAA